MSLLMYISISHLPSSCFSSLTQHKCDGRNGQPIRHKWGPMVSILRIPNGFLSCFRCYFVSAVVCVQQVLTTRLAPHSASRHFSHKSLFPPSSLLSSIYIWCACQTSLSHQPRVSIPNAFLPCVLQNPASFEQGLPSPASRTVCHAGARVSPRLGFV